MFFTGMAGEDALGNAVLGGASDYISDVGAYFGKIYSAPPSERVWFYYIILLGC